LTKLHYTSPPLPGLNALSCSNDFAFESHIHSGHVLWLNSEGGEQYQIQGQSSILQPGTISVIEPGVVHSNQPSADGKRHLRSLYLEEDFFRYLERLISGSSTRPYHLPTKIFFNRKCWQDALLLHEAILSGQDRLLLEERVISLFNHLEEEQPVNFVQAACSLSGDNRIVRLVEYMHAHLDNDISLETLSEVAQCTSFHVIRLFKEKVGLPPHAYLIQIRLEKARRLIDGGVNLTDAALCSGFSDQSHLTRRFKKRYGITPGVYSSQSTS